MNLPPPLPPAQRNRISDRMWLLLTLLACALGTRMGTGARREGRIIKDHAQIDPAQSRM